MKKILLIAYREFIQKVKNKTFLLTTLLLPIGIAIFYGAIFYFTANNTEYHRVAISDSNHRMIDKLKNDKNFEYHPWTLGTLTPTQDTLEAIGIDAIVYIPKSLESDSDHIQVVYNKKIGIITKNALEKRFQDIIESMRFQNLNIDSNIIADIKSPLSFEYTSVTGEKENDFKEQISYFLSYALGLLMYVILTIYGSQVMRGVMEEKTNRIAEVIISSVKPFELMIGKILGIGLVCLLQFALWGLLLAIINFVLMLFIGGQMNHLLAAQSIDTEALNSSADIINSIKDLNLIVILLGFLFYFIGGFFLYSAMFASVGSAINEDPQEAQTLMMPIMMPIFLAFVLLTKAVNNPNGTEALIGSMVPFTSPVVMMSRLVFGIPDGVPVWQLLISMAILVITIVVFMILSARIYRIGILSFGQKPTWMQLLKWIVQKN